MDFPVKGHLVVTTKFINGHDCIYLEEACCPSFAREWMYDVVPTYQDKDNKFHLNYEACPWCGAIEEAG